MNKFNLDNVPLDDKDTFDLIGRGLTKGLFQLESFLARTWCKKIKPRSIEELSDVIAIIRPGALQQADNYVAVKNRETDIEYIDRRLAPILKDTKGILLYQEQLIKIVQLLAGFSESEADVVRKMVGKKLMDDLKKVRPKFVNGCMKNGVPEDKAEELFDIMQESGSYSFNKSHSMAYAINAYRSAYLKAHYPTVFFWSCLRCAKLKQHQQTEIEEVYWDMKNFGIELLPPTIKEINKDFEIVDENTIAFGITSIKGIGESGVSKFSYLEKCSGWREALHCIFHKKLSKAKVEPLIKSGTFDCFGTTRSKMMAEYNFIKSLSTKQLEIFMHFFDQNKHAVLTDLLEKVSEENKRLKIGKKTEEAIKMLEICVEKDYNLTKDILERKYLGINLTSTRVDDILDEDIDSTCSSVMNAVSGNMCVMGVLESVNKIKTKREKKEMAFIEISDMTQKLSNIVVFNEVFMKAYYDDYLLRELEQEVLKLDGYKKEDSFIVTNITKVG